MTQAPVCEETIQQMLAKIQVNARRAEFEATAKAKLIELVESAKDEKKAYRDKRKELVARWEALGQKIDLRCKHLHQCHPDWKDIVQDCICKEVMCRIETERSVFEKGSGSVMWREYVLGRSLDAQGRVLDAWKGITTWIDGQLTELEALLDEICQTNTCDDPRLEIYILHFELMPRHRALAKTCEDQVFEDPVKEHCGYDLRGSLPPAVDLSADGKGSPASQACPPGDEKIEPERWPCLIPVHHYDCVLADRFKTWKKVAWDHADAAVQKERVEEARSNYESWNQGEWKRDTAREVLRECPEEKSAPSKGESSDSACD